MKRWIVAILLLTLAVARAQDIPQEHPAQTPDTLYRFGPYPSHPTDLAPGPGRELVAAYCSVCHSTTYITMQPPLPAKTWDAEVHKMIKVHGASIPDTAAASIIDYLSKHYTPETRSHTSASTPAPGLTYKQTCIACHQEDGRGLVQVFPALAGRAAKIAQTPEGRTYLLHVALFGMQGKIVAAGQPYDGVMPGWGTMLSDASMADVLTYVTHAWGASSPVVPYTATEVAAAREHPMTSAAVHDERLRLKVR